MAAYTSLITGASSGLGMGMAREFAALGHDIMLCARRTAQLESLQQELQERYADQRFLIAELDVNDYDAVFRVFRETADSFGHLDRVIVNAGIGDGVAIGAGGFEANLRTANTNFAAALAQCEAAVEIFRKQNSGHLVCISSVSAVRGFGGTLSVYAATKAALGNLAEGIRAELMDTPIEVSTIYPGYILTDINKDVENAPFRVDVETGCRALVKAIEAKKSEAYVPGWPWAPMARLMKIMPLSLLRKLS